MSAACTFTPHLQPGSAASFRPAMVQTDKLAPRVDPKWPTTERSRGTTVATRPLADKRTGSRVVSSRINAPEEPHEEGLMSTPTKPSIVFCHGIWADGSCFNKLIPPLQAEGYEVISAQYGLNSNVEDVAATVRYFGRVSSPIVLVGHSYGGAVITAAGTDYRVAGLVYIAALGLDETETSEGEQA